MITREDYLNALELIDQYHQQLNLYDVSGSSEMVIGSLIRRTKMPTGNGFQKKIYTIGKIYKIEKIKYNYRNIKKAVGLRSDDNVLRWLSYDRVIAEHELVV